MIKSIYVVCLFLIFTFSSAYADINKLIKNLAPKGTMSNVTTGAIIKEQSAGHLMGGSVIVRTPAEPGLQLLHLQAPSCKFGGLPCGAQFDILGGGLSVVNGAELVRHLKGLATNAATYGAMMLIKTMCPQCEDLMAWLDAKADWINNLAQTDCQDMIRAADGILNKITSGQKATRQSAMVLNGEGKDIAHNTKASTEDTGDSKRGNPQLESMLGDNYNLTWKALSKKAPSGGDNDSLKEMLMSISGTVIGKKDAEGKRSVIHKKSLINKELIEEFAGSISADTSKIKLYSCDEKSQCLDPKIAEQSIKGAESLMGKISDLVISIAKKIKEDKGQYTNDEETLIAISSLSLITKIELDLSAYTNPDHAAIAQTEFVQALCYDLVTTYLSKLLQEVQTAVSELEYIQIADGGAFKAFELETRETMKALSQAKNEAFKRYDLIAQTKARIKQEIHYFELKFEEFCSEESES